MARRLLALTVALPFLLAASCPPGPPTPQPTPQPTPAPTPTPAASLLLRQPVPPRLTRDGQPFTPFGAIQCCVITDTPVTPENARSVRVAQARKPAPFSLPKGICNTLWPLASECWMDYTRAKGANFYHFRMGPFLGDINHETDWMVYGGPYQPGTLEWNPAFWQKFRDLLDYARAKGANVEVVPIDTWGCKVSQWGSDYTPWPAEDIDACGRRPSSEQERYIRKVVSEAKDAPHVVWITDNEQDQIQGDTCEWAEWVRLVIRDEESRSGGAVRMVGTNNLRCGGGPFDYVATHARSPLTAPFYGKHSENNERNPQFVPEQEHANFCAAQGAGLHWWFWRADMAFQEMEETLALFRQGCGESQCFPPPSDDPLWQEPPVPGGSQVTRSALEQAKTTVGSRCGLDGYVTLDYLGAALRSQGECSSRMDDSVFILDRTTGKWHEHHAVAFTTGCYATNPEVLPKATWTYLGTNPTPAGCPYDPGPVTEILCKILQPGQGLWDCTPKVGHPPRPIPEDDPNRWACELKAMGGQPPVYQLESQTGALGLSLVENPMQWKISGSGTGIVRCTVPATPGDLCNTAVSR